MAQDAASHNESHAPSHPRPETLGALNGSLADKRSTVNHYPLPSPQSTTVVTTGDSQATHAFAPPSPHAVSTTFMSSMPLTSSSAPENPVHLGFQAPDAQNQVPVSQPSRDMSFGDDLDLMWSNIDVNSTLVMPQSFSTSYPMNFLSMSHNGIPELEMAMFPEDNRQPQHDGLQSESDVLPRYGSRLPSLQPIADEDYHVSTATNGHLLRPPAENDKAGVPWRLSKEDYGQIHAAIQNHERVLPVDFAMPSRHALCRYVEGYFSGFHEHLPFIHLPTFSLVTEAPELILAIAATGSRYQFQRKQSHHLYLAARALLADQIRRRDTPDAPHSVFNTPSLLSDGTLPSHSPHPRRDAFGSPGETVTRPSVSTPQSRKRDTSTMQAMVILIALGTWNDRSLIKDAFSTASQLALMVREDSLASASDSDPDEMTWREWVTVEGRRRTKIVSFCFLNLHSIAYNITPQLMNAEIGHLNLPGPESHWRAESEGAWEVARRKDAHTKVSVQSGYASLFANGGDDVHATGTLSSFGNYVLAHCIVQQIFFTRQSSFQLDGAECASLAADVQSRFDLALRAWQRNWETTKDSSLDPSAPGGPLSFNSTALFRLAYIRLHANLGPCRQLESRDAMAIARAFHNAPLLERSTSVGRAVLQSAHSLSIPVRIGIEFVARTQTLTWSIIHSLCNLECGLFLGKWLETIASALADGQVLREDEKRLLGIVASIIGETDLGPTISGETDGIRKAKLMATAVVRLWAYTFKGAHVFDIMGTVGAGLELCADMLQQELNHQE